MYTDASGKLYVYLPAGANTKAVTATADGKTYTGTTAATATLTLPIAPTKYAVKIIDGGTGTIGGGNYAQGATVTLAAGTKNDYTFSSWTSPDVTIIGNTFTMPAKAVTVTANWTAVSTPPAPPANQSSPTDSTPNVTNTTAVIDKIKDSVPGSPITVY